MANSENLPYEIMVEIFSRLPTKSVGKCKCLSKSWNSHLSTSQFIKLHLIQKPHQENIILITESLRSITLSSDSVDNNAVVSSRLDLHDTWSQVWGSCNGLVLLENVLEDLYLVNPVTLQKVKIPLFDLALRGYETNIRVHGFGYDSRSDDYKIVTLSSYDIHNGFGNNCDDTFVDVYYVKTGVWKRLDNFPYDYHYPSPVCGAFVHGAIHWLAEGTKHMSLETGVTCFIVAFDLASEVFYEVPSPPCAIKIMSKTLVLGGRLCLANECIFNRSTDIWLMEEYGMAESWTRKFGPAEYEVWDTPNPLCFIGEDEVLLTTYDTSFIVHNMKEQTSRYLDVDGVYSDSVNCASTFVDSLVSVG